jgi:hypothetical protein
MVRIHHYILCPKSRRYICNGKQVILRQMVQGSNRPVRAVWNTLVFLMDTRVVAGANTYLEIKLWVCKMRICRMQNPAWKTVVLGAVRIWNDSSLGSSVAWHFQKQHVIMVAIPTRTTAKYTTTVANITLAGLLTGLPLYEVARLYIHQQQL